MVNECIVRLLELFMPYCHDITTMEALRNMAKDHCAWTKGHLLFDTIRPKTLLAIAEKNSMLEAQYTFEEVCAETLYNLSMPFDPFDPDTPFWIVPNAFALAKYISIERERVVEILAHDPIAP